MLHSSLSLPFAILVLISHSHVSHSSARPRCHPDESAALLELNTFFWNKSEDCCTWFGITCDEGTGHVIGLRSFLWTLPSITSNSSLFSLRRLQRLQLSNEDLRIEAAGFKALVRNLTDLKELDLSRNDMSSVPPVLLTNFSSSLMSLRLESCQLHGVIPDNFLHFQKLELLDLSWNNLGGKVPRSFLNLESLAFLSLDNNDFEGRIPEFCSDSTPQNISSNLTSLSLSGNSISGPIPSCIFALPNLEVLLLSKNNFSGEIGEFQSISLTNLDLSRNELRGVIPRSIFQQVKLKELDLWSNNLTGTVYFEEISKLKELSRLILSFNNLSLLSFKSPMNHTPSNLSLASLDLSHNQIQGSVPKWLWKIGKDSLENLDLSHNSLTYIDLLPWNKLNDLDLSFNLFSGALPILSPYLTSLVLSHNQFAGEIPSSICNLTSLLMLDLSYNGLSGKIPECMNQDLSDFKKNKLHGTIISPWSKNNFLHYLDLRSNMFSGPLPILSHNNFLGYSVSNNQFSGDIPASFCNLKFLVLFDLSHNNLSGKIPRCIGNSSQFLSVLDLRSNKLRGSIPATFAIGNVLTSLNLNGNQLEGALPRSLVNCRNLTVLDLGNNFLNDTFPYWLESLPELQVLILRANRFHGTIENPTAGSPFLKLRIMDISYNEFSGALPAKYFDNFKAMQTSIEKANMSYMGKDYYLDTVMLTMKGLDISLERILTILTTIDFSSNNFTGEIPEILGELESLKGLNLSHNGLKGIIPSSLGKLKNLEWLDLSSNELAGKIPVELADIPWLSFLYLSHNHLAGPIPRGRQFNTFGKDSFLGNSDLCGFPLSKSCSEDTEPPLPTMAEQDDDDSDSSITNGFNWRIVLIGYGSGFIIGISIGYMLLYSNGKLSWLSERILKELPYTRAMRPTRRRP